MTFEPQRVAAAVPVAGFGPFSPGTDPVRGAESNLMVEAVAARAPAVATIGAGTLPEEIEETRRNPVAWVKQAFLVIVFFHLICVGWLFFRAGALPAGVDQLKFVLGYLKTMAVPPRHIDPLVQGIALLGGLSLLFQWKADAMNRFSQWPVFWQATSVVAAIAAIASLGVFEGAQFIYFQF